MPRIRQNLLLLMFLASFVLALSGCHRVPDEQRIRQAIDAAAQGTGQVDASALTAVLTDDFDGNGGTMGRKDLGNLLRLAKLRGETVHVVMGPVEMEPRGDRYIARFTVTLGSGGKLFPAELGVFKVETAWRREGRDWHCYTATWTQQL
ncbi:hypothetical protein [Dyella koreensis]|uniref:Nuclear transport factor 2 family protein n=1 Tax=Dyella koreensis TaxID=311235 RepID=A0ABW8K797_9GAMM